VGFTNGYSRASPFGLGTWLIIGTRNSFLETSFHVALTIFCHQRLIISAKANKVLSTYPDLKGVAIGVRQHKNGLHAWENDPNPWLFDAKYVPIERNVDKIFWGQMARIDAHTLTAIAATVACGNCCWKKKPWRLNEVWHICDNPPEWQNLWS
jgi:hypothetical protein